jgi:[acyl-carrier-protein] S-malonyltransferase
MSHGHGHADSYTPVRTRPPATGSSLDGTVIGWVNGRPVPRAPLDRRIADLRTGPMNAALPVPGSPEDRQLARWLTQVILTEVLCEEEARSLGLSPAERPALDRLASVELGSINAAALNGNPWVRALYEHVTSSVTVPSAWQPPAASPAPSLFRVRHRRFASRPGTGEPLDDLGMITLDSLPSAVASELRRRPYGTVVGPVEDSLGWHLAAAHPARDVAAAATGHEALVEAARRRTFAQWLDRLRADKVDLVPGLEHPGDPRQPDNHHKH